MKESYIKNNSHNYGDSRHSVTLKNVINDNSHCTFRSGVCTRLVSDVIRKPYAASVWVREIAGWNRFQLISLLRCDNSVSLKKRKHVPFPDERCVLSMQLCITKLAITDCRVGRRSRGSCDDGLGRIGTNQRSSQLKRRLIYYCHRMNLNIGVVISQPRNNICVKTISVQRKSTSVNGKWTWSD
jgi:hypothetical protein